MLADENNISIKVAKFSDKTRINLTESNEYGYCSLIKATKSVLDKIDIENRTFTKITSKERQEKRLWNAIALREAIVNAFVHSDYTREVPPKFEIFSDRIENNIDKLKDLKIVKRIGGRKKGYWEIIKPKA